jgi:hypothetical protein
MSSNHATQCTSIVRDALLDALPGDGHRRTAKPLEHGWRIVRGGLQIAAGYDSDNAGWHAIEFAFNQDILVQLASERAALIRRLERQKQRFGGREPNVHQRGKPVH